MWKAVFVLLLAVSAAASVLVGGLEDVDPTDEGVRNALNFAVVQHNRQSNDVFLSQVAEVVRVQRQVVSGLKYIITVNMARSLCTKRGPQEGCKIQEPAQPYQCTFTVWHRTWLNDIRLVKQMCLPSNKV